MRKKEDMSENKRTQNEVRYTSSFRNLFIFYFCGAVLQSRSDIMTCPWSNLTVTGDNLSFDFELE